MSITVTCDRRFSSPIDSLSRTPPTPCAALRGASSDHEPRGKVVVEVGPPLAETFCCTSVCLVFDSSARRSDMAETDADLDELIDDLVAAYPPDSTDPVKFLGEQFDRGLAWVALSAGLRRAGSHTGGSALRDAPPLEARRQQRRVSQCHRLRHGGADHRDPRDGGAEVADSCAPSLLARRSGVNCSPNPAPLGCGRASRRARSVTGMSGSSTAKRSGRRWRTSPRTAC